MIFDLVINDKGDGGDAVMLGHDLAITKSSQNMIYLGLFGGNIEQSTNNTVTEVQSFDFWGNNLLMRSDPSIQFNSTTERILKTTPLNSAGRVTIQNAIKKDLEFFKDFGTIVDVIVTIVSDDRISAVIQSLQDSSEEIITVVNFKKQANGDWYILDFNNDFYFG